MKWSVDGKLSTFLQPAGRANGMYFDAHGNLIACADEKTELWSITPDGKHTVLAKEYEGKRSVVNARASCVGRSGNNLLRSCGGWWSHHSRLKTDR